MEATATQAIVRSGCRVLLRCAPVGGVRLVVVITRLPVWCQRGTATTMGTGTFGPACRRARSAEADRDLSVGLTGFETLWGVLGPPVLCSAVGPSWSQCPFLVALGHKWATRTKACVDPLTPAVPWPSSGPRVNRKP